MFSYLHVLPKHLCKKILKDPLTKVIQALSHSLFFVRKFKVSNEESQLSLKIILTQKSYFSVDLLTLYSVRAHAKFRPPDL